uniref:Amino acid transporter n=1 Tax=Solanum tuberosum TaxID=4113 RepID=M1ABQ3_SOLTU
MRNSVSDHSFYIESDEEDDHQEKHLDKSEENGDGNESDSSNYSNDDDDNHNDRLESKPSSYNPAWPQSYRQSMDIYSSVPSPSLTFLGTPSLTRLGSSFLASSLTRRHTPEVLPSLHKPLISQAEEDQPPQRRSSHTLLPPLPSRRSAIKKFPDEKSVAHELPVSRQSSYGQGVLNGINVLCGVGILSTPYAVKEGGWAGLSLLFIFGLLSYYTGILLRYCLDSQPGLETYPDIGQAAFGTVGRIIISIILYVELYSCCVEYIILEGDNLSALFPNAHLNLGGYQLDARHLFALVTTLAVLPTVWLRDLTVLSYISAGGVIASVMVVICLYWLGLVDHVGTQSKETVLNLSSLPVAIGLYGYCYSGHAVFPNIYTSLEKRSQFPAVLFTSFAIVTALYAGAAVMGYMMFGDSAESQFTLNLPTDLVASKIAFWTTIVNPFTKYALTMAPVAMSLEELIPSNHTKSHMYSILIRTALVMSTLFVALKIPFFGKLSCYNVLINIVFLPSKRKKVSILSTDSPAGFVMALIGSFFTMLVTLILPCACFLRILKGKTSPIQVQEKFLYGRVRYEGKCFPRKKFSSIPNTPYIYLKPFVVSIVSRFK